MKEEDVNQPIRIIIPVPPCRFADGGENLMGRDYDPLCAFTGPLRSRQVGFRFVLPADVTTMLYGFLLYVPPFYLTRDG